MCCAIEGRYSGGIPGVPLISRTCVGSSVKSIPAMKAFTSRVAANASVCCSGVGVMNSR